MKENVDLQLSFFVVGTQKAGTTTLFNWLNRQPDVLLPRYKETHYFSSDENYRRGLEWYYEQFPRGQAHSVVGEIDPDYMFFEAVPYRMYNVVTSPKLIFIFREPIRRAYSQYLMSVRRGYENMSFYDALLAEEERLANGNNLFSKRHFSYMARGRYAEQLQRFQAVFPHADLLFVRFEDMVSSTHAGETFGTICHFLDLKSEPVMVDPGKVFNVASAPRFPLLRDLLYDESSKHNRLRWVLARLLKNKKLKQRLAIALDRFNRKPLPAPDHHLFEVPPLVCDRAYQEIHKLERLTGLNLDSWMKKVESYVCMT